MTQFTVEDANSVAKTLIERKLMSQDEAGAFAIALSEIHDESVKLFSTLIPTLIMKVAAQADVEDLIWDIQEACAHIHHHAKECKLPDDVDPWVHLHSPK